MDLIFYGDLKQIEQLQLFLLDPRLTKKHTVHTVFARTTVSIAVLFYFIKNNLITKYYKQYSVVDRSIF